MAIAAGDIVQVSQRGRLFHARVTAVAPDGALSVAPLDRTVRARRVASGEVVDHWAHAGAHDADGRRDRDQLDLNEWIDG